MHVQVLKDEAAVVEKLQRKLDSICAEFTTTLEEDVALQVRDPSMPSTPSTSPRHRFVCTQCFVMSLPASVYRTPARMNNQRQSLGDALRLRWRAQRQHASGGWSDGEGGGGGACSTALVISHMLCGISAVAVGLHCGAAALCLLVRRRNQAGGAMGRRRDTHSRDRSGHAAQQPRNPFDSALPPTEMVLGLRT